MAKKRPTPKGKAKPRKSYALVSRDTQEGQEVYALLARAVERYRPSLETARIGLAWSMNKKPDRDGHIVLGKLKKLGELDRLALLLDAVVILNREQWELLNPDQRLALMHHELCHLDRVTDSDGDHAIDGHGLLKWRTVKHDIEEFTSVVQEHGYYKNDLAVFVSAALKRDKNPTPALPFADGLGADAQGIDWKPGDRVSKLRKLADVKPGAEPTPASALRLTELEINTLNDCALAVSGDHPLFTATPELGITLYNGTTLGSVVQLLRGWQKASTHDQWMANRQTVARIIRKIEAALLPQDA